MEANDSVFGPTRPIRDDAVVAIVINATMAGDGYCARAVGGRGVEAYRAVPAPDGVEVFGCLIPPGALSAATDAEIAASVRLSMHRAHSVRVEADKVPPMGADPAEWWALALGSDAWLPIGNDPVSAVPVAGVAKCATNAQAVPGRGGTGR